MSEACWSERESRERAAPTRPLCGRRREGGRGTAWRFSVIRIWMAARRVYWRRQDHHTTLCAVHHLNTLFLSHSQDSSGDSRVGVWVGRRFQLVWSSRPIRQEYILCVYQCVPHSISSTHKYTDPPATQTENTGTSIFRHKVKSWTKICQTKKKTVCKKSASLFWVLVTVCEEPDCVRNRVDSRHPDLNNISIQCQYSPHQGKVKLANLLIIPHDTARLQTCKSEPNVSIPTQGKIREQKKLLAHRRKSAKQFLEKILGSASLWNGGWNCRWIMYRGLTGRLDLSPGHSSPSTSNNNNTIW